MAWAAFLALQPVSKHLLPVNVLHIFFFFISYIYNLLHKEVSCHGFISNKDQKPEGHATDWY